MAMTEQDQYRPRYHGRPRAVTFAPAVAVLGRLLLLAVFAVVLVRVAAMAFHFV